MTRPLRRAPGREFEHRAFEHAREVPSKPSVDDGKLATAVGVGIYPRQFETDEKTARRVRVRAEERTQVYG